MTAAIPTRMLVLLGLAVAALAAVLVVRPLVLSDSKESTSGNPVTTPSVAKPAPTPAKPASPSQPRLRLLPGLPAPLARELRYEKVVVVSLYSADAALDRRAAGQAVQGAKAVDAGFVALNVASERGARNAQSLAGVASAPAVLVVSRPGKVITRFDGFVDSAVVAQAAANAGAGK